MESARHQHPISNTGQTKAHTINDEDVLVRKLERHRVKLPTHVLAAHLLAGHDERAADVPVLDEPFAVGQAELLREVERGDARRVRDGDDDVDGDVVRGEHALHLVRERVAHRHARAVDADPVEDRVRPREVDVLEDVGRERRWWAHLPPRDAAAGDDDRLACRAKGRKAKSARSNR